MSRCEHCERTCVRSLTFPFCKNLASYFVSSSNSNFREKESNKRLQMTSFFETHTRTRQRNANTRTRPLYRMSPMTMRFCESTAMNRGDCNGATANWQTKLPSVENTSTRAFALPQHRRSPEQNARPAGDIISFAPYDSPPNERSSLPA